MELYHGELIFDNNEKIVKKFGSFIIYGFNHYLYYLDHNKNNNYLGRVIQDIIVIKLVYIICFIYWCLFLDVSYYVENIKNLTLKGYFIFLITFLGFELLVELFLKIKALWNPRIFKVIDND